MLKFIIRTIFSGLLFLQVAQVQAADEVVLTEEDKATLVRFINGNTMWVLYHETGHALISLFDIPILAKEEDAADNFATLSMLFEENEQIDEYLRDTAWGWFLFDELAATEGDELDFADEHSLDQQRAYQTICFLYGSNEEKFEEFTRMMEMPEERLVNCAYDYDRSMRSWEKVLNSFVVGVFESNVEITVTYADATEELAPYKSMLQESQILENIHEFIDLGFKLPHPISIIAKTCDEANAYWDPNENEIVLCYELLAEYEKLFRFDVKQLALENN